MDCHAFATETIGARRVYRIESSPEGLNRLVADLGTIWQNFDSATLIVETERFGESIVVEPVTLQQTAQIINQDSMQASVTVAQDVAVLNSFAEAMPGRYLPSTTDGSLGTTVPLPTIPRPVLTSDDPETKKIPAVPEGKVKANLTIVLLTPNDRKRRRDALSPAGPPWSKGMLEIPNAISSSLTSRANSPS